MWASFRWMSELDIENTRSFLRECAACRPWWASRSRSTTAASKMQILAGLEVTTKSVERTAEAIGDDIVQREQEEIQKVPAVGSTGHHGANPAFPILYVQMDGTGVPVVKKETAGRHGKDRGPTRGHTREAKLGCVFTQTTWDQEGYAIRDSDSTTYTGAIETAR